MTNLDSIFKSRDVTLPTKVHLVKAMVFSVVMYGCESSLFTIFFILQSPYTYLFLEHMHVYVCACVYVCVCVCVCACVHAYYIASVMSDSL